MGRKLLVAALFAVGCLGTMYAASADAAEEAPPPRPVEEQKPDAKGKFGGKIDPDKLKALKDKFGGKIDPEKLKEWKDKIDPEKIKAWKDKIDPEKRKQIKDKFGKKKDE